MNVRKLTPRTEDGSINVVVEIPAGSRNKYEYDEEYGIIVLDRPLYTAVRYPTDYGFVPGTKAEDGDPLDVLIMVEEPTFPGCLVRVRLLGLLIMEDGESTDTKLLAEGTDVRTHGWKGAAEASQALEAAIP
jgi:inorganic pyrophosphatase